MDRGYTTYIVYVAIFSSILLFIGILALKRRKGGATADRVSPITGGSIGVFFDQAANVIIIPYAKDKYGRGRATAGVQILKVPYAPAVLGNKVRIALQGSMADKPCSDEYLMEQLGFRAWKDFSEGKRNLSVHYREDTGLVFNSTTRRADGSYQFNRPGFERIESSDVSNARLGEVILELLKNCR